MTAVPLLVAVAVLAQSPPAFPAAKHSGGELRYVNGVPVLAVRGSPAEIGGQIGTLAVKPAGDLPGLTRRALRDIGQEDAYPALVIFARRLKANLPADHLAELEAAAKASGHSLDLFLLSNTMADVSSGLGCSTLVIEPARSTTGSPLFGRNFDWAPTKGLTERTLVAVFRPTGKHAFASVTYPTITGVLSGINDAGLAIAMNEIRLKEVAGGPGFDWAGAPLVSLYRRVLEECSTVAEAEKLVAAAKRTTSAGMTLCDGTGGAVFEITPKAVSVRRATNAVCCCTNHFVTDGLIVPKVAAKCDRLPKLLAVQGADRKLGVADVFAELHAVNQGRATLQSMVFEPKERRLHLKYGDGPATRREAVTLELDELLKKDAHP
jgi:hypothetical protein